MILLRVRRFGKRRSARKNQFETTLYPIAAATIPRIRFKIGNEALESKSRFD
ncbi:hypothetical protein [Azospirillum doebereinerae]